MRKFILFFLTIFCFGLFADESVMSGIYEGFPLYRDGYRLGYDLYPYYRPKRRTFVMQFGKKVFNPPLLFDPADYAKLDKLKTDNIAKTEQTKQAETQNNKAAESTDEKTLSEIPQTYSEDILPPDKTGETESVIVSSNQVPHQFNKDFEIRSEGQATIKSVLSQAGLSIKETGSLKTIHFHGFTDTNINIYIDGVLANSQQNGGVDFKLINMEAIDSITYCSPVQSPEPSVGGSLFITTKSEFSEKATLNINQNLSTLFYSGVNSSYSSLSSVIPVKLKKGYFTINPNINYLYSHDKYLINESTKIKERDEGILHGLNAGLSFNFHFLDKVHNLKIGSEYSLVDQIIAQAYPAKLNRNDKLKDHKSTSNVSYSYNSPSGLNTTNLSFGFKYSRQDYPKEFSTHILSEPTMLFASNFHFLDHYDIGVKTSNNFVLLNSTNLAHKTMFYGSASLINRFVFLPFTLEINNRILYTHKNILYTPGISMDLTFPTKINSYSVGLNVSRVGQYPTANALYWEGVGAKSNPNLKLEHGIYSELYTLFKGESFALRLAGTATYYIDKISWRPDENGFWSPINIGKGIFTGAIANLEYRPIKDFKISLNYDFIVAALMPLKKGVTLYYGERIMYVPEHTITAKAVYDNGSLCLEGNLSYNSFKYISNLNLTTLPSKVDFGLMALYRFKYISPYISLDNITHDQTPSTENYPTPGFRLTVGAKLNFEF